MIESLIKLLQEAENETVTVLNLLHHLRAMFADDEPLDLIYVEKIINEIIAKVEG